MNTRQQADANLLMLTDRILFLHCSSASTPQQLGNVSLPCNRFYSMYASVPLMKMTALLISMTLTWLGQDCQLLTQQAGKPIKQSPQLCIMTDQPASHRSMRHLTEQAAGTPIK
jgi:hypothetical protein